MPSFASRLRAGARRRLARLALRVRGRRPDLRWALRLTTAAVVGYVAAEGAWPGSAPLTAPLTALLVVQLTPVGVLTSGLDRVLSVVAGVGVAVLVSSAIGLNWWSLGLIVGISLLLAQMLRLGNNLLEVPISAMLILGAGASAANAAAWERIGQTLVGAAVGVLAGLVLPARVGAPDAGRAIDGLAQDVAGLLEEAAQELASDEAEGPWLVEHAQEWLGRARLVTHGMPLVGKALLEAEESRRLNVRALRTRDAGPGLRQGLEALEHSAVAVRSLFATVESVAVRLDEEGRVIEPPLRASFALALEEMAGGLRSFGALVREEARRREAQDDAAHEDAVEVEVALQDLHEARARIDEILLVYPREDLAVTELLASLGATAERLLRELDLDERERRIRRANRTRRPLPLRPPAIRLPRG